MTTWRSACTSASPGGCATSGAALALRAAVPRIPADRLMVETDAPYLLPRDLDPHPISRRNEPKYLAHIAPRRRAHARRVACESLAASTTRNAVRFFRLDD